MTTYVKTVVHQLFPAPTGLTATFSGFAWTRATEAEEEDPAFDPRPFPKKARATLRVPVVAYAVVDVTSYRHVAGKEDRETNRVRRVEPLLVLTEALYDAFWLDTRQDHGERLITGLGVLSDLDQCWETPDESESDGCFLGYELGGASYGITVTPLPPETHAVGA
jgi:hypothetical protein